MFNWLRLRNREFSDLFAFFLAWYLKRISDLFQTPIKSQIGNSLSKSILFEQLVWNESGFGKAKRRLLMLFCLI